MIPLTVNPAMDPIRNATWLIPRERPSSSAGVASTIIAALFVNRIADPRPCTARNAMTWAGLTAMLVRREPNVKTPKPLVYSFTRPVMSETRPIRRSATVLPRTYAWVIQIACSGSAWRLAATCGSPMITLLELDALHVEVPEDVRDEPVRLVRVLDHVDVLVHEPLQLRDVLALLPDRLADVPFLHDENQLVGCVDAVDDGRPREILEESDVFDRLFVKDNLDHAASGAEDVRVAGAEHRDGRDREGHPAGGPQVDVRAGELQQANLAEGRERVRRAVRRDDDDLRALRLRGATDFSQSEAHLARVRRDPARPGDVDHGTTSSMGSSGSTAAASGAGTGTGT